MKNSPGRRRSTRISIVKPTAMDGENERVWQDVKKFASLIPSEPDPNMGRVAEIKEEIRKGNYFTPEVMEETAARLAIRFMTKE